MSNTEFKKLIDTALQNKTSEKLLEKKLRDAVRQMGGIALKFHSPYETGYPDRIIFMPGGKTFFAELKTTGKKPTPKQLLRQKELRALGFVSEIIDSESTLNVFLKRIENESNL